MDRMLFRASFFICHIGGAPNPRSRRASKTPYARASVRPRGDNSRCRLNKKFTAKAQRTKKLSPRRHKGTKKNFAHNAQPENRFVPFVFAVIPFFCLGISMSPHPPAVRAAFANIG